jgi:hypothetical protein
MDRASRDRQRVPLSVAAAVVLFRVTGEQVDGRRDARTVSNLNAVARALARVAPIYAAEPDNRSRQLGPLDLLRGDFDRGARVFRTFDGRELGALAIERRDMVVAINVLQATRIRLR